MFGLGEELRMDFLMGIFIVKFEYDNIVVQCVFGFMLFYLWRF